MRNQTLIIINYVIFIELLKACNNIRLDFTTLMLYLILFRMTSCITDRLEMNYFAFLGTLTRFLVSV